jgi:antitoxin Phd
MRRWQLQEAKAKFSAVVKSSRSSGPQEITVHGETACVILSKNDYDRLTGHRPTLVEFLRASPLVGVRLNLKRDKSLVRDLDV